MNELSYFALSLLSYLTESHPNIAANATFITSRGDSAAEAYSDAVKNGHTHTQAEELANEVLYRGLHFSPYNTIVNILWNEFAGEVPEEKAREIALHLLPLCGNILTKYTLTDDFTGAPQYNDLYTELTGTIQILLEDGIQ